MFYIFVKFFKKSCIMIDIFEKNNQFFILFANFFKKNTLKKCY